MLWRVRQLLFTTTALVSLGTAGAFANPLGPQVAAGTVQIDGLGTDSLSVQQSTDKAIVNWNTFDVGLGETTTIVQPGAESVLLNRVTGGLGASQILGTLNANGQVFLVNPDGVLFGRNATVDVGSLVVTTHDLLDDDFLSGNYAFGLSGSPDASIVNLGTISVSDGGFAALVAPGVRNDGIIGANLGKVALASGNSFSLDLFGDGLIKLAVDDEIAGQVIDLETGLPLKSLVANSGLLRADGGTVQITASAAREVLDSVINNTGMIEANTVGTRNGKIVLSAQTTVTKPAEAAAQKVKVSGRLSAVGTEENETGGDIEITGEELALTVATIEAFGWNGGGTVLVGGDVGGGNITGVASGSVALADQPLMTATSTTVDATSTIDASATGVGSGGKVIVWADDATKFAGSITARGGGIFGDGGFVEVSGHERLAFGGIVNVGAGAGDVGTLLLDPQDVSIGGDGAWTVDPLAIEAALLDGHVLIQTGSAGSGQGNITINSNLELSNNSLVLVARHNIVIADGVTITSSLDDPAQIALATGTSMNLPSAKMTGTGAGTVIFQGSGKIDFSQGGDAFIVYNPVGGFASPTDFSSHVAVNDLEYDFWTYMWVNNPADLQNVATNLKGRYLLSDIDMSGVSNFTPIGDASHPFEGELYGTVWGGLAGPDDWATISNLTITSSADYVGLFGVIGESGYVERINVVDANITGTGAFDIAGVLAGRNYGTVVGSSVTGAIDTTQPSAITGGLVGYNDGYIGQSSADVSVETNGRIVTGSVNVGVNGQAGGLVGVNTGLISNSFALGPVTNLTPTPMAIGGLVGLNAGEIQQSYARGDVTSQGNTSVYANQVAGLVGAEQQGSVSGSYSTGAVLASGSHTYAGGLIGWNAFQDPVSGSYWDVTTSGLSSSAGGTGLPTADLTLAFPNDPDESGWGVDPDYNHGYPYLAWERHVPGPLPISVLNPLPGTSTPTVPNNPTGSDLFEFVSLDQGLGGKAPLQVINIPDWSSGHFLSDADSASIRNEFERQFGDVLGVPLARIAVGPMFAIQSDPDLKARDERAWNAVLKDPTIIDLVHSLELKAYGKATAGAAGDLAVGFLLAMKDAWQINADVESGYYGIAAAEFGVLMLGQFIDLVGDKTSPLVPVAYDLAVLAGAVMEVYTTNFIKGG